MGSSAAPSLRHLLLLLLALSHVSGSAYQESGEDDVSNDFQDIANEKRATNLGNRLDSRNCGAFNLGKKFIGYQWLRSMESRQRRTPLYLINYRPHEALRNNDQYLMKSFRY